MNFWKYQLCSRPRAPKKHWNVSFWIHFRISPYW